jgi:hypothetical protein
MPYACAYFAQGLIQVCSYTNRYTTLHHTVIRNVSIMSILNAIKYEQVKKYPLSIMLAVDHEILHNRLRHWFVCLFVCLVVLNATFNNMSVISWWSVLLVEETGGPGENHRPAASH